MIFRKNIISFLTILVFATFLLNACSNREEIASVKHTFSGCFGGSSDELIIYKKEGKFFARLTTGRENTTEAILNNEQMVRFRMFINDLRDFSAKGGCTSQETYQAFYKGEYIERTDGSCGWNGFDHLRKYIFPNAAE